MNPMKAIRIEKVTLNMGIGEPGPKIEMAKRVLKMVSGVDAVVTKSRKRSTFGVAKGREIGAKVTLRGKGAEDFLKRVFAAIENKIKPSQFDANGNFSFGINEYINIPGIKYDPEVGIMGFDVCVTLERPGFRVKRKRKASKIGKAHLITKEDAIEFIKSKFGIKIEE